jgi:hypothetical protein
MTYELLPLGTKPRAEGRAELHLSLFPGETQELSVKLTGPAAAGTYQVCIGVLQEAVTWIDTECSQVLVEAK